MKVVDLDEANEKLFFVCLEDWSAEMREAGDHRERWYGKMKGRGLRAKLALDDRGVVGGMIQYVPIEWSPAEGRDLYFVHCVWVHGHKEGRGDFQKRGMGKALLKAAEDDVRAMGRKGLAAWGIPAPFWMSASWFEKHGYEAVDKDGYSVLLWKPFDASAEPPTWIRGKKSPEKVPGHVAITVFKNGWCPSQNLVFERAKRAAAEIGDRVAFRAIDTSERNVFLEWGIADGLFVDGEQVQTGPPPSYESVKKLIAEKTDGIRCADVSDHVDANSNANV